VFDKNDLFGVGTAGQARRAIPGEFSFSGGEIDPETGGAFFYHTRAEDKTINVPLFGDTEGFQQTTTRVITDERRWVGGKGEEEEMGETKLLSSGNPLVEFDEFDHDFMNPLFVADAAAAMANNNELQLPLSSRMADSRPEAAPLASLPNPAYKESASMVRDFGQQPMFPTLNDLDPLDEGEDELQFDVGNSATDGTYTTPARGDEASDEYLAVKSRGASVRTDSQRVQSGLFTEVHLRRMSERSSSSSRGAARDRQIYDDFRQYLSARP